MGSTGAHAASLRIRRILPGHQEGFANVYTEAATAIRALRVEGGQVPQDVIFPTAQDGFLGLRFIDVCVRSSTQDAAWVPL